MTSSAPTPPGDPMSERNGLATCISYLVAAADAAKNKEDRKSTEVIVEQVYMLLDHCCCEKNGHN